MRQLLLLSAAAYLGFGYQSATKPEDLPLTMTWLRGRCVKCNVAVQLGTIQFTTDTEGWGIGDRWPSPGGQGAGDYIVMHSKDAGLNWTEIPYTQTHAAAPMVSFVDPENGWLSWLEVVTGASKIQRTHDGGKSWRDMKLEIDTVPDFFDESHWHAVEKGKFLATDNAGKTWRETQIPLLTYTTQAFFRSRDVGWIVSTDFKDVAVSRTIDGGRTWTESRIATAEPVARVADLFFLDAMRGWLVAEYGLDEQGRGGSHLFSTVDGGATWSPEPDLSFQGEHRYMGPTLFVSAKTGFIFESTTEGAKVRNALVYTTDGGTHWRSVSLSRQVSACQIFEGDLRCSAKDNRSGFWILTLHPK